MDDRSEASKRSEKGSILRQVFYCIAFAVALTTLTLLATNFAFGLAAPFELLDQVKQSQS